MMGLSGCTEKPCDLVDLCCMRTASLSMQQAVDGLASRLGRPAVIEDYDHRVVVFSEHDEPIDEVRSQSILRRRTTTEVVAWLRQQGIVEATEPVRIPGCPKLHMLPRVCVPVRYRGTLLGYVWFVDADCKLSLHQLRTAVEAIGDLAMLLFQDRRTCDVAFDLVRSLLSGDQPARVAAARAMVDDGHFAAGQGVAALVASSGPDKRVALVETLASMARSRGLLYLVRQDHGVLLTTGSVIADLAARLYSSGTAAVVGVGAVQERLDQAADSYRQARHAMRVAAVQPELGPVASWDRLGVYRVLESHPAVSVIHPGLAKVLADPASRPLIETLELYLDLAGNAEATARRLHLHRTSLYYRLGRIEALAGTSLKDGAERLSLHLALKAARLGGA